MRTAMLGVILLACTIIGGCGGESPIAPSRATTDGAEAGVALVDDSKIVWGY